MIIDRRGWTARVESVATCTALEVIAMSDIHIFLGLRGLIQSVRPGLSVATNTAAAVLRHHLRTCNGEGIYLGPKITWELRRGD